MSTYPDRCWKQRKPSRVNQESSSSSVQPGDNENEDEDIVENENDNDAAGDADVFVVNKGTMSVSCFGVFVSALKDYYKQKKVTMTREMSERFVTLVQGYKRVVAAKKSRGVMSITEGKAAVSFNGYCEIAGSAQKLKP